MHSSCISSPAENLDPITFTINEFGELTSSNYDHKIHGGTIRIPEGVRCIVSEAFNGCDMSYVDLPNSLEVIDSYSFVNCKKLKGIHFPYDLKWIGRGAFKGCTSMEWIYIENRNTLLPKSAIAESAVTEIMVSDRYRNDNDVNEHRHMKVNEYDYYCDDYV